jgi:hypothetical protein
MMSQMSSLTCVHTDTHISRRNSVLQASLHADLAAANSKSQTFLLPCTKSHVITKIMHHGKHISHMIEFSQNKILFLKTRFCFSKQDFVSQNKI